MCVLFTGTFKVPNKHLCPAPYRHHQSHPFPLHSVKNDNSENHCQANTPSYSKSVSLEKGYRNFRLEMDS